MNSPGTEELRFDGQVAVITGAGRGLGREYALELGRRGARVVAADLGCDISGDGRDPAVAEAVAEEIRAGGGEASAVCFDLAEPGAAEELVQHATDTFGQLDIAVNNVGGSRMYRATTLYDRTSDDIEFTLRANLVTAIAMSRAVWPGFEQRRYGRMINISSASAFGILPAFDYATAKAGIIGLTRSFALAGRDLGIKVNAIMPNALTRAMDRNLRDPQLRAYAQTELAPQLGAPLATLLAHERCPVNGETFSAAGRIVTKVILGETQGVVFDDLSAESIARHMDRILDTTDFLSFYRAEDQAESYAKRLTGSAASNDRVEVEI